MILRKGALILGLIFGGGLLPAPPAMAQDTAAQDTATLVDLRAQLRQLTGELQSLRTQLVASGAAGFQAAGGDTAIDRMNAMETRLTKLTGQIEKLQNRIERVVTDGTRRIEDIEFRLCEMDPNCDLGALMSPTPLGSHGTGGGIVSGPSITAPSEIGSGSRDPAAKKPSMAEQQDFDRAQEVLGQGDFQQAAQLFAALAETYAGGPLTSEALFLRGSALDSAGQPEQAAAAWLEAFAADPQGKRSGESLLGIGRVIADRGDRVGACLYLSEIPVRFAGSEAAIEAQRRMAELECGTAELPPVEAEAEAEAAFDAETATDITDNE